MIKRLLYPVRMSPANRILGRIVLAPLLACYLAFAVTACNTAQVEASAAFIGAEVATAQILAKNPQVLPVAQAIVSDWSKFQLGTLTAADEANLLQQIVAATKGKLDAGEAALLDGAVQQILANQNASAPTPLQGAAGAIITDVVNGIARAIVVAQTPAPTALYGRPSRGPDNAFVALIDQR